MCVTMISNFFSSTMYACMYVYTFVCIYANAFVMYVCMYVCMYGMFFFVNMNSILLLLLFCTFRVSKLAPIRPAEMGYSVVEAESIRRIFYSSLYRASIFPRQLTEYDSG